MKLFKYTAGSGVCSIPHKSLGDRPGTVTFDSNNKSRYGGSGGSQRDLENIRYCLMFSDMPHKLLAQMFRTPVEVVEALAKNDYQYRYISPRAP